MKHRSLLPLLTVLGCSLFLSVPRSRADSELKVISPAKGEALHLGDTLTIGFQGNGDEATAINAELAKGATHQTLHLYLDHVEIPGLTFSPEKAREPDEIAVLEKKIPLLSATIATATFEGQKILLQDELKKLQKALETANAEYAKKPMKLHFLVDRHSDDDDSRRAWDKVLQGLKSNGHVTVSLAVAELVPMEVLGQESYGTVSFAPSGRLYVAAGVGVFVALLGFGILFLWPRMLKDGGDDSMPYSLGRSQMAFWGIVILGCWVGVWIVSWSMERIPSQALVLMGISSATALSATLIGTGGNPGKSKGFWSDLCMGDNGPGYQRLQVVAWTLVLGCYFVANVFRMMSMPEFSETLLVLMGISHLTYLGFKPSENAALGINSLQITVLTLTANISGGEQPYTCTISGGGLPGIPAQTITAPGTVTFTLPRLPSGSKTTLTVVDHKQTSASASV